MKENSREEDILNIEKYVELVIDKNYCDCNELNVICSGRHCDGSKNVAYSMQHILSDYKRVLKENEELKIKNNAIKRESEAYAENMIRLDNELNLEKEKSKYEWIRQNCLPQELVNKLYIPVQKVKDKIIDLMSEQLAGLAIFNIDKDETLILSDKEEVKQYYENKAKELINR